MSYHNKSNSAMDSPQNYSLIFFMLCLVLVIGASGCSTISPGGQISEPSKKDDKIFVRRIYLEIKVNNIDGKPAKLIPFEASTSAETVKGRTNSRGETRISIDRKESEPLLFTFFDSGDELRESVHTLPSSLTSAGLVFEKQGNRRIKFTNYTAEGLYR
ncbi:MAG TPA: hypothetical protein PKA63_00970 [Oligoflexia bacterium]|nr:hypothetical protein [Oligoflexia bacterium]HMP47220.1 hypothetical protein [Oligoflexia bacterium]